MGLTGPVQIELVYDSKPGAHS